MKFVAKAGTRFFKTILLKEASVLLSVIHRVNSIITVIPARKIKSGSSSIGSGDLKKQEKMDTERIFKSQTNGGNQDKKIKIRLLKDSPFQSIEDMPWTREMKKQIVRNTLPGYPENAYVYAIGTDLRATSTKTGFKLGTVNGKSCVIAVDVNN